MTDELRAMFEAHCAKIYPNFGFKRFSSDMQTYSGQYTDSRVNTRWEAWQACHAAMQGEDVRRDAMSSIEQIAHRWAMASYAKALGRPFEDIDSIRRELGEQIGAAIGERHG